MAAAATAAPSAPAPVMPADLSEADQALWRMCNQQYNTYKATQKNDTPYAKQMDPLELLLQNNKASAQQRVDFCSLLDGRIKLIQRLHKERSRYIELDCDRFDWLNAGMTAAQRLARHKAELKNVDDHLQNLYGLSERFCK